MEYNNDKSCQTYIKYENKSTQTDFDLNCHVSNYKCSTASKINWLLISQLLDMFRMHINAWNSVHERVLSVIICMIFKIYSVKYDEISGILSALNCLNIKHALKWCESIVDNNDLECVFEDRRGKTN